TDTAVGNLAKEGITQGVYPVGDVMYDVALLMKERAQNHSVLLDRLRLKRDGFQLATLHRAENTDDPQALERVLTYLKKAAADCPLVLPLHPRTRNAAIRFGFDFDGIRVIDTVGYLEMTVLLDACSCVLTDSGGLQKEAYFHRKPCVTLRDATE